MNRRGRHGRRGTGGVGTGCMRPKSLLIIGAGNFGREVYAWAKHSPEHGRSWVLAGFLDDRVNILDGYSSAYGTVSAVEDYAPAPGEVFACALGDPASKQKYAGKILERGGTFINVVHPTAVMGENVRMGIGIILCPYVVVSSDVTLNDFVTVNTHSNIGHDVVIGKWTQVGPSCAINGRAIVGESVFMGSHATILPHGRVGDHAVVGAGSVVLKKVEAGTTVFGVPAKKILLPPSMNK